MNAVANGSHTNNSSPPIDKRSDSVTNHPDAKIDNKNTNHEATSVRSRKAAKDNNVISFTLNWICIVLTVAATIVFGIWAPLSYRATADGNRENNEVQSSMMQQVITANVIATSALSAASAQSTALVSVQSRLGAMGQLALVEYCAGQTV